MKDRSFELVTKYALLLSVFYLIYLAFENIVLTALTGTEIGVNMAWRVMYPHIFNFGLNLVAAYIVALDIRKYNVKTKYVILSTILYRPIGVLAFLIFFVLQSRAKTEHEQIQINK
jgi:hypothetical protein